MRVSNSTIERWFMTIGPFKGVMRLTSKHPSGRDSWPTYRMLKNYLAFILSVKDHSRLVFANKKPMKELNTLRRVRRDVRTGAVPRIILELMNSKNRYSILTAVNIKGGTIPPVKSIVLEESTDSSLFLQFIRILLNEQILKRGDVFIVDNCSVHVKGDNIGT